MSIALYRKYRPKNFSEVSGQNHIKITLQNEIKNEQIGHAYLFCGPRGTGKTTLARLLSKSVNCLDLKEEGEACNKCSSCQEITAGNALDIIEIDAASHTGVDNIRENIINNARFTPAKAKYKVFIIDEVHMLSISAFNALLKILEEPPKYVIFILATTEIHKVPVTIISRCQRFDFKKINFDNLMDRLRWIISQEEVKMDDKVLELIVKNSGGCVRDAESLLEQVLSLGEKNITLDQAVLVLPRSNFESLYQLFNFLVKKKTAEAIEFINYLVEEGVDIPQFMNDFVEFVRKGLVYKVNTDLDSLSREIDEKVLEKFIDDLKVVELDYLVRILEELLKIKEDLKNSYIVQLPLELLIVKLTSLKKKPILKVPVSEIVESDGDDKDETVQSDTANIDKTAEHCSADSSSESATTDKNEDSPAESLNLNQDDNNSEQDSESQVDQKKIEPESQITNEPPLKSTNGLTITLNQIQTKWSRILQYVRGDNYSLGMSLSVGKPVKLEDKKLTVAFLFDLPKEKASDPESLEFLSVIINKIFGVKLKVVTIIDPNLKINDFNTSSSGSGGGDGNLDFSNKEESEEDSAETAAVADLVADFGGEVVG